MTIIKTKTDEQLVEIVRCMDRIGNALNRRFEGDDGIIVDLMNEMGLKQTIVDKMLIAGLALRECVARGIKVEDGN